MTSILIHDFSKPWPSGRVYDRESFEKAVQEYDCKCKTVPQVGGDINYYDANGSLCLEGAAYTINSVTVQDDKVIADISLLKTPEGQRLQENLERGYCRIGTMCTGSYNELSEVTNIDLISLAVYDNLEVFDEQNKANETPTT